MNSSSLIFLVIIGIWAAFLLQHWVGRREHAATARAVERFSSAMRVLEQRPAVPREVSAPRTSSAMMSASPLAARRRSLEVSAMADTSTPVTSGPTAAPASRPAGRPGGQAPRRGPHLPTIRSREEIMRARRIRAGVFLATLAWVPLSLVLGLTGTITLMTFPVALLMLGASVVWLGESAKEERAAMRLARRGARLQAARVEAPAKAAPAKTGATAGPAKPASSGTGSRAVASNLETDVIEVPLPDASAPEETRAAETAASAPAAKADRPFDVSGADAVEEKKPAPKRETRPAKSSEPVPGAQGDAWSPQPVPRPTYSMKAPATPRMTDAEIPADIFETEEFADEMEELDVTAMERRAVNG